MKPGMGWPIGIAAVLLTSVAGNLVLMRIANNDPSFAIERDYYQRAVAFDTTMREASRSDALGWTADMALAADRAERGALRIRILDRNGAPVPTDSISVVAFFNARANDRFTLHLSGADLESPGVYRAVIPVSHRGQWEVQVDAWRGSEHFVATSRVEVTRGNTDGAPTKPLARVRPAR